jgi:glycerol-3-phosphate dehydrogenase
VYGAEREMACTVADVLMRRTQIAFETRDAGRSVAARVAALMAPVLGWGAAEERSAVEAYDREAARVFTIEPC